MHVSCDVQKYKRNRSLSSVTKAKEELQEEVTGNQSEEGIAILEDEPGAIKINFQSSGTEIEEGYMPDYGEVYAVRNGYTHGWNTS